MQTLDEDNSNEIDYNEFASSGVVGGKFFAARDPKGFSGEVTKKVSGNTPAQHQAKLSVTWSRVLAPHKLPSNECVIAGDGRQAQAGGAGFRTRPHGYVLGKDPNRSRDFYQRDHLGRWLRDVNPCVDMSVQNDSATRSKRVAAREVLTHSEFI